jgi:hypothetical protein
MELTLTLGVIQKACSMEGLYETIKAHQIQSLNNKSTPLTTHHKPQRCIKPNTPTMMETTDNVTNKISKGCGIKIHVTTKHATIAMPTEFCDKVRLFFQFAPIFKNDVVFSQNGSQILYSRVYVLTKSIKRSYDQGH